MEKTNHLHRLKKSLSGRYFLCACGVGSTPVTKDDSPTDAPSHKSSDIFVENAINCPQMDDSNYVYYYSRLMLNPKKNLVWLGSKYNKNSYEFVSYMMFEKKEYFVPNMVINPLQKLLTSKQITSTI